MEGEIRYDDVSQIETKSETHLEDDFGTGNKVIIRCFEFGVNPEAFKQHKPSKTELVEHHRKQIEMWLWKDHLRPIEGAEVRVVMNKKKNKYSIFVCCHAARGNVILEKPKTLAQLAHNT